MSYTPTTDFVALLRNSSLGEHVLSIPGLDFTVSALARAGLIRLSVGQTAPLVNQSTTAWLKPSLPSWAAEGILYLWDAATAAYEPATTALWINLLSGGSTYSFQSATAVTNLVTAGTSLLAVQRVAPATTSLMLPNLAAQWNTGRKLQIIDFSTGVVAHAIALTTPDGSTIMQRAAWQLLSTADQLAGITLQPSPELNSWVIAP